jgi:2-polyprenyl-3-methyl-5-hydroxy-6-metoxy-1,4-benzoquinol methylase
MAKGLTLGMVRLLIVIILFLVACSGDKDNAQEAITTVAVDTTKTTPGESFDLQVRKWEDPKRQTWQDPKFVIEALGDLNGLVIADIGSGTGYFTFQMAVPAKKVIAIDIEQRFLNYIEDRKSEMYDRQLAKRIETRLTTPTKPSLLANEVDVVLMVNTIGYIKDRAEYLDILIDGINNNGRLIIVDYKIGKMPVGPDEQSKVSEADIKLALQNAGFILDKVDNQSLQYQYLIKAHKAPE